MGRNKEKFCLCNSSDGSGFMVFCDSCQIWFHGKCVKLTKKEAAKIPNYFCDRCKQSRNRCGNPECVYAARSHSKYCSDECGEAINRKRYEKIYRRNWERLERNHSCARLEKMRELQRLESEKEQVLELIGKFKRDNEDLVDMIDKIKEDAKRLRSEREESANTKEQDDEDSDSENEDREEAITGDQSKTFCNICGITILSDNTFKHWATCHRKQESNYNFTSDAPIVLSCRTDETPKLYCQKQDKKTKRYCMHIESACPQHSNWHIDKDEVCACPANIMQKLTLDENYCLELKRDCTLHYNWDRFRLASKNMERIQAFSRLDALHDRIARVQASLNDTYGGVIGIMTHRTIDNNESLAALDGGSDEQDEEVDVEMNLN